MAYKFVTFCALVTIAHAGVISSPALTTYAAAPLAKTVSFAAPVAKAVAADEYDPHPEYSYSYAIADALTGDQKEQHETRSGDVVQGSYSLVEPDGSKRIVEYFADPIHGFNAVVHREPLAVKAVAAATPVIAAKTVIAQPAIATKTVLSQSAPLAKQSVVAHH